MSTPKGNKRGQHNHLLAIDCETTGLCFSSDSPVHNPKTGERHQAISWGLVVADSMTLKPVEELYLEIKWNENSAKMRKDNPQFGKKAEEIHGLTRAYLEQHGLEEEEAVLEVGALVLKYWGPVNSICTLGHNVHTFDMPFLRDMCRRQGVPLKFGNRHMDSNSLGFGTVGSFNSDDLFNSMGMEKRGTHNALDDAKMALESFRRIRVLWQDMVGVKA